MAIFCLVLVMQEIVFLEQNKIWKYIVLALGIGWEIFGFLILSVFIGLGIDHYFGIKPIGILLGSVLGIISSFKHILRLGGK